MLTVTSLGWGVTIGLVTALLALDLVVSARWPHAVGPREAALWSVFYVAVAVGFGIVFGAVAGWGFGAQ